jgi:protein-disulfide isomerase
MNKIITAGVIVLLAIGFGFWLYKQSPPPQATPEREQFDLSGAKQLSEPRPVEAEDHVLGNREAKNTMVVYGDFQCPACRNYEPVVKMFPTELRDTKVVFRHFPLLQIHPNAAISAFAAEAAAAQGKFWEMSDELYNNQDDWASLANPKEKFIEYAKAAGVANIDQFKKDLNEKSFKPRVQKDLVEGVGLGVNSTPSLYFNGKKVENKDFGLENLKKFAETLYIQ